MQSEIAQLKKQVQKLERKLFAMFAVFLALFTLGGGAIQKVFAASSDAPNMIAYQGRILDASGVPISDASKSVEIAIYDASSGGNCVYSVGDADSSTTFTAGTDCPAGEPGASVSVTLDDGLFTVYLGDTGSSYNAIPDSVFRSNNALYLDIEIAGDQLTPRKRLVSSGYALRSDTAGELYGTNDERIQNTINSELAFSDGTNTLSMDFDEDTATAVEITTSGTTDLILSPGGNVGIGKIGPTEKLEVDGTIKVWGPAAGGSYATMTVTNTSTALPRAGFGIGTSSSSPTNFGFRIFPDKTTEYQTYLEIDDMSDLSDAGINRFFLRQDNSYADIAAAVGNGNNAGTPLRIGARGLSGISSPAIYISNASNQNVGIGTTGPDAKLDALSTSGAQLRLTYTDGTVYSDLTTNSSGNLMIDASGTMTTISDDLTITGDDLYMTTNTSGFMLVADGTNYNPVDISGDIDISSLGAATISADSVALTTDTTGNYVASVANGSGISGGAAGSEGATLTLALGALTADWDQTGAYDITLNNASSELKIKESAGDTYFGTLDIGDLSADATYTFSGTSGTVLTSANVASSLSAWDQDSSNDLTTASSWTGGDLTGTGLAATIANDKILESMLKAVDSAVDEDILTYESTTGDFEWHASSELGLQTALTFENGLTNTAGTVKLGGALTGATTVTAGANAFAINLDSTGDFSIQDAGVAIADFNDNGNVVFNESGALYDFRVEGDTITNLLLVDGSADSIGIGTATTSNGLVNIDQNANAVGLYVEASSNGANKSASGIKLTYSNDATYNYTGTGSNALFAVNMFDSASTGDVVGIDNAGSGDGIYIYQRGSGKGLDLDANVQGADRTANPAIDVHFDEDATYDLDTDFVKFTVSDTASTGTVLTLTQSGTGDIVNFFDGATEAFTIIDGGSVGIGDSTPSALLTVGASDAFQVNSSGVVTLANASANVKILESTGATYYGTLDIGDLSADATYTFSGTSGTVLTSANVASTLSAWDQDSSNDLTTTSSWTGGDLSGTGLAATISADSVALTTDTTGNYVASVANGSGISGGAAGSEGATLTLALGALTADWDQTGAYDITLNNASSELKIKESAGGVYYGLLDIGDLSADATYTFSGTSGTVLTSANVASSLSAWDQDSSNDITTASNGLTAASNNVKLGGTLTESTTVTQGAYNMIYDLTSTGVFEVRDGGATAFYIDSNGKVGVGASSLTDSLTTRADSAGAITSLLRLENLATATLNSGSDISFFTNRTTGGSTEIANVQGIITDIGNATYDGELVFNTASAGVLAERMRIDDQGYVGIGTSAPLTPLEVQGVPIAVGGTTSLLSLRDTTSMALGVGGGVAFRGYYVGTSTAATFGAVRGIKENATSNNYASALTFYTRANGGTLTEQMRIASTGNTSITGDLTITGDDLYMGTNTSGFMLVADGTNYNPVDISGDIDISSAGAVTISADSVALTTDTTGNYVASVANGSGISGGAAGSEGATLTLALGALTADWDQTGAYDISLNNASSELKIKESAGDVYYGTFDVTDLTWNRTYTFPNADGSVCLDGGSCDSTTLDTLDSTAFLRSNASDTFEGDAGRALTIQSSLSGGVRAVDLLNITQANDATYSSTGDMVSIEQLDTASSSAGMYIENLGIGNSITVYDSSGDTTPVIIDSSGNVAIGTATTSGALSVTASSGYSIYSTTAANAFLYDTYIGSTSATVAELVMNGNDLFVSGEIGSEGKIYSDTGFDAGNSILSSDALTSSSTLSLVSTANNVNIKPDNDADDYLYVSTGAEVPSSDASALYWEGVSTYTNDPGISVNAGGEIVYRDEDSSSWVSLDSLNVASTVDLDVAYTNDLDKQLDIGSSGLAFDLNSTADYTIEDNGTAYFRFANDKNITYTANSSKFYIDGATNDLAHTSGLLDMDIDTGTNGASAINVDFESMLSNSAGTEYVYGMYLRPTKNNTGLGTHVTEAIRIASPVTTICGGICQEYGIRVDSGYLYGGYFDSNVRIPEYGLYLGSTEVLATATELNLLDGLTATNSIIYGNGAGLDNTNAVASGQILVGNVSNVPAFVDMSGDVTIDNTGVATVVNDSHTHGTSSVTMTLNDSYTDGNSISMAGGVDTVLNLGNNIGHALYVDANETYTYTDGILFASSGTSAVITDAIDVSDIDIVYAINVGNNIVKGTTGTIDFTDFDVNSDGAITLAPDLDAVTLQIVPSIALTTAVDLSSANIINALSLGDSNIVGTTGLINYTYFDVDASGNVSANAFASTSGSAFNLGASASNKVTVDANSASLSYLDGISFASTGASATLEDAVDASDADIINAINVGDNIVKGGAGTIDFTDFDVDADGAIVLSPDASSTGFQIAPGGSLATALDLDDALIATAMSVGANDIVGTTGLINYTYFDVDASGNVLTNGSITAGTSITSGIAGAFNVNQYGFITQNSTGVDNASTDLINLYSDVGTLNGSDVYAGLQVSMYGNTGHTGVSNYLYGVNIDAITSVANITETAIAIGDGWEKGIDLGNNSLVGTTGSIDFTNFDVDSSGNLDAASRGAFGASGAATTASRILHIADTTASATVATGIDLDLTSAVATTYGLDITNASTGTNSYGGYIVASSATNNYGLYIDTATGSTNYALYTEDGRVRFGTGGTVSIADASTELFVQGDIETDGNLLVGNSGGTPGIMSAASTFFINVNNTTPTGSANGKLVIGAGNAVSGNGDDLEVSDGYLQVCDGTGTSGNCNSVTGFTINDGDLQVENVLMVGYSGSASGIGVADGGICIDDDGGCDPTAVTDGNIKYLGQDSGHSDVAEVYGSNELLQEGDVVVIDVTENGKVRKSSSAYESGMISAVSTAPGSLFGSADQEELTAAGVDIYAPGIFGGFHFLPNTYPIALAGRVPVKVNTENGAIQVGDLITSSQTAGVAMKSTKPGAVIGKALEPWAGPGQGMIEVFIMPGWNSAGMIATDGTVSTLNDNFALSATGTADALTTGRDSFELAFSGSGWDGASAVQKEFTIKNVVTDASNSKLSIQDETSTEVAYIDETGTMMLAGDLVVTGRMFPSDRGVAQTNRYIYYDSTDDYVRTNAAGWSVGSYDFAEMFPSDEHLEPGDIVEFTGNGEKVGKTAGEYSLTLGGIVSTRPGFLAGTSGPGKYPVALAGRVPTKVNLEGGAIKVGDPLTSSSVFGIAMKARSRGPVVGYALEPYNGSNANNKILAYVNVSYYAGPDFKPNLADNTASQAPAVQTTVVSSTSPDGDLYMNSYDILNIGAIAGFGGWSIAEDGTVITSKSYEVKIISHQNEEVATHAALSTQHKITLSGEGKLSAGIGTVDFELVDPKFNDVISTIAPIRVIVTLTSQANGIFVDTKGPQGFRVVETSAGASDATFDWYVEAYRTGYEPAEELIIDIPVAPETTATDAVAPADGVLASDPLVTEPIADATTVVPADVIADPIAPESSVATDSTNITDTSTVPQDTTVTTDTSTAPDTTVLSTTTTEPAV